MSEATDFQMQIPDPALKRLDFLVGKWEVSGTTEAGPMGPPGQMSGWESYEWLDGGFFLVHRYETRFDVGGATRTDSGYEFFDTDPATGRYRSHFFNSFGPYDTEDSRYHGDFDGDALVVVGPARITRRPNGDGTLAWQAEVPDADGGWTPWMHVTLTKIG